MNDYQAFDSILNFKQFVLAQQEGLGQVKTLTFYDLKDDKPEEIDFSSGLDVLDKNPKLFECYMIKVLFRKEDGNWNIMDFYPSKREIKRTKLEGNKSLRQQRSEGVTPVQTMEEALADPDCTYYQFAYGAIGKYDPKTQLYYILEPDFTWKEDHIILDWMTDAQYDYEVIPSSSHKERRGMKF